MKIALTTADVAACVHAGGEVTRITKVFEINAPELEKAITAVRNNLGGWSISVVDETKGE